MPTRFADAPLAIPPACAAAVIAAWSTPPRAYHDLAHLDAVLAEFHAAAARAPWRQPREVYWALCCHDAIYVAGAADNEARSAELADALARAHLPADLDRAAVRAMILATARHGAIAGEQLDRDTARMLDCDLAISARRPTASTPTTPRSPSSTPTCRRRRSAPAAARSWPSSWPRRASSAPTTATPASTRPPGPTCRGPWRGSRSTLDPRAARRGRGRVAAMRVLAVVAMAFLVFACGDDGGGAPFPVPAECNPLGGGHCMEPWPSSVYELADATSATGVRLAIPVGGLLTNSNGDKVDPAPWNKADGFSAAAAIVTAFPGGVDDSNLVDQLHFADSLTATSPTVLLDLTTGERVAHFAELDVTAASTPDSEALYIRPAARLTAGHRYGVAIRKSLKAKSGGALAIRN